MPSLSREEAEASTSTEVFDFVDFIRALYRNRWLVMGLPLVGAAILGIYGSWAEPPSATQATLELGHYNQDQEKQNIGISSATIARLEAAIQSIEKNKGGDLAKGFAASHLGGGLIQTRLTYPPERDGEKILSRVMAEAVQAHEPAFEQVRTRLEGKIETARARRDRRQKEKAALQQQRKALHQEKQFLREEIASVTDHLDALRGQYSSLKREDEPFNSLLLLNSEQREASSTVRDLRERLEFQIPERMRTLRQEQAEVEAGLAEARAQLAAKKVARSNLQPTQVAVAPHSADATPGPGRAVWGIMGLAFGGFLGVLVAVAREIWHANRHRIVA